jgi:hypothetical protein
MVITDDDVVTYCEREFERIKQEIIREQERAMKEPTMPKGWEKKKNPR